MREETARSGADLKPWAWSMVLCGLLVVCYWPAMHGQVLWDDQAHLTAPDLRSWAGLGRIWFELGATQQYYPVLHSAFWFEHRLWGDAMAGYHLLNVLLHATACCLLARALRRWWSVGADASCAPRSTIPAGAEWLAAFIFAVHPVCVESVAWISEQKNTLSLVFYLLAGLSYLDFHQTRSKGSYAGATVLFVLALGVKTVTGTLPAALLVLLWWRLGKISLRRDLVPLLPWFLLAGLAGVLTAWVERKLIGAEGIGFDLTFPQRLLLAGHVIWFYVEKLAWPFDLMFIYPRWLVPVRMADWLGYSLAAGLATAGLWSIRRHARGPLAGWLFFAGSLFPALGFFNVYPFIFSYVADHFQYLASLGIVVVFSSGVAAAVGAIAPRWRVGGWLLAGLLVAGLGCLTHRQSRIYGDAETLYRATLAVNPECWMAHNNLGLLLARAPAGEAEAMRHYEAAVRIRPGYAEAHNNLGFELSKLPGRQVEAMAHFNQALQIQPDYAEAHCNLANVLATLDGRMSEALAHYAEAVRLKPGLPEIHFSYANVLAGLPGRQSDALAHYAEALRLKPDYVGALMNLGIALAQSPGRESDALASYERALRIDPGLAEVHYNLALLLARLPGRGAEAIDHFQEALRLQPKYARAHNNLAALLARQQRWEEARRHWVQALELDPDYEDARRNLQLLDQLQRK